MELSENDQKVLDDMEKRLEEMTGKPLAHVFIDTDKTLGEGVMGINSEDGYLDSPPK